MTSKNRAVIYARVSKDTTGRVKSVSGQVADARAIIAARGWDPGPEITDNDISASRYATRQRPGYQQLLRELRQGDVLILWEASRAHRQLGEFVELRTLCEERGVLLCIGGAVYDLDNPADRQNLGFGAVVSEGESHRLSKRVADEKRRAAESGQVLSRLPWGYRKKYAEDGKSFQWMVDETYGAMVREMADHLLAGRSLKSLARKWNEQGKLKPTGKPWTSRAIKQAAVNPAYAARKVHHRKDIGAGGQWPAILTEAQHFRLLALLNDPDRATHRGSDPVHLLTGLASCGRCGGAVTARSGNYVCRDHYHLTRREAMTDEKVVGEVFRTMRHWRANTLLLDIEQTEEGYVLPQDDESGEWAARARELRERLDTFAVEAAKGNLSAGALVRIEQELLPEIQEAERRAAPQQVHPLLEAIGRDPAAVWESLSLEEKRGVVRLCVRVRLLPTHKRNGGFFDPGSVAVTPTLTDHRALTPIMIG